MFGGMEEKIECPPVCYVREIVPPTFPLYWLNRVQEQRPNQFSEWPI